MSQRVRCAVVGVGYLGRFHAQKYKALSDIAELVAVSDASSVRAAEVAKELDVPIEEDYRRLIGRVDAVTIAASTRAHFEIAKHFLANGVHVNLEKPMTSTLAEAEELVALADRQRLKFQIGHVERFNPALQAVQPRLKNILFVECHRLAPFKPRGVDVDVILDLMIHDLDVILSLVKSEVKSVSATGVPVLTQTVDIANARIEFASGTVANVTASRVSQTATRKFRVFQPQQYTSIDFGTGQINITKKTGDWPEPFIPGQTALPLEIDQLSLEKGDALLEETRSFLNAIHSDSRVVVDGRDGLNAMRLAGRIQREIAERLQAQDV